MRWEGRRESENVNDRRGMSPAMVGGGGGLITIVIMAIAFFMGADPRMLLQMVAQQQQAAVGPNERTPEQDRAASFVKVVLADTEDVWNDLFPKLVGKPYQEPQLDLFTGATDSACGRASSAVGPFYCPGDNKVYLDLGFFTELQEKFKAPGDFACAYVIAHEVGHHVQNLLGLSDYVSQQQARSSKVEANQWSVRLELQADFLAGVWAHHAQQTKQILEAGDIGEAMNAAEKIGDDTLQREATGRVRPDAFTHGSSKQRIKWFTHGLKSGNLADLNLLFETPYEEL
ncbi:MAG: neutral zinc metallopeptidase [Pirellulaceae bacterium]|nr:neutral zinc metallopeptidase [Pirellulaceae bacterium]